MENAKYHTVGTIQIQTLNRRSRYKIHTPNTHIHEVTFVAWYRHFSKKWRG